MGASGDDQDATRDEVTRLLNALDGGDRHAADRLLPLVYDELRRLAAQRLAHETPGQTLQPTALVHEAYLRLVGNRDEPRWQSQAHFFGAAAEAMRRILIDEARRKQRPKHGGDRRRLDWHEVTDVADTPAEQLLDLNQALDRLEHADPPKAALVKLRFFAGLTMTEAAQALGVSRATAERSWAFARAWLLAELTGMDDRTGE
jgi:RNA polymerase sigma factor (TIGR02999 family)